MHRYYVELQERADAGDREAQAEIAAIVAREETERGIEKNERRLRQGPPMAVDPYMQERMFPPVDVRDVPAGRRAFDFAVNREASRPTVPRLESWSTSPSALGRIRWTSLS